MTRFDIFLQTHELYKEDTAFIYRNNDQRFQVTYDKFFTDAALLHNAFKAKKITHGSKVLFVCDNRYEWIVTDFALISLGAISIPRGSDTTTDELEFIASHSEADFLIIENEQIYNAHKSVCEKFKNIFIIEAPLIHKIFDSTYSYNDLLAKREISNAQIKDFVHHKNKLHVDDTFTLIYTSGTTGNPKAVILTHQNVMHNVNNLPYMIRLTHEDLWLSILPSWHIFERAAEYIAICKGCTVVYSTIKTFASDLEEFKPTLVATVPRLWESMYSKINQSLQKSGKAKIFNTLVGISTKYKYFDRLRKNQLPIYKKPTFWDKFSSTCKGNFMCAVLFPLNLFAKKKLVLVQEKFGGRLRLAISGGGTLPEYLDCWIDALGIRIVNAYGMSECAPGIAGRSLDCDVFGTLGYAVNQTTLKIVDTNGQDVTCGEVGEIWVQGPQVTKGYYKSLDENKSHFSVDGFFRTGDLGKFTYSGELVITGRSKEIIVLANGENIDPSRIESAISLLPFVQDAVLVGQDKKGLGMLIVPDVEQLKEYVKTNYGLAIESLECIAKNSSITQKIRSKMNDLLDSGKFKPFEKIQNIHFVDEEFKKGEELTNTYKKKRYFIEEKYRKLIDKLLK